MVNTDIRLIVFLQPKMEKLIQSAKTRLGADCGSVHEHFIVKFRIKLKKEGETTRPFRYDLKQIPYDYTVEVRRFKGLDLIDRVPVNYGWRFMTLYRKQESRLSPWKRRNAKRVFSMTSAFSWQNSISLCPASFCTPRPNLPVTPGVS